jgi:UDP-N-acetylglucosamine 4,6-dehydratase
MTNIFVGKNILVTGGTGSIGSEIVRRLLQHEPKVIRILSNDENGLFNLEQELASYSNVRFLVGDVKDKERLQRAVEGIDYIFHSAALKHVPLCEYNPFEAVKTNVLGTQNVIDVAIEEEIEKLISISTDKAVNPINVMGATKLLAERLTISANYYRGARKTIFSCVRFGNVLDSRGSVIPLFREQIRNGGPVTITDPDMTRFIMSIPRAIDLVLKSAEMAQGGEIFIFKMPVVRIGDLAKVMIEELAPKYGYDPKIFQTRIVGRRTAEKNYEELMTHDEALRACEIEEMFIIYPEVQQAQITKQETVVKPYHPAAQPLLSPNEIKLILKEVLRDH